MAGLTCVLHLLQLQAAMNLPHSIERALFLACLLKMEVLGMGR